MTLQQLIDHVRKHVLRDFAEPPLWDDATIVMYANEALWMVASRAHVQIDDDREIPLVAGEDLYALETDIKFVYRVRLSGKTGWLKPLTESWTPESTYSSTPIAYTEDRATGHIRFFPTPDQDYTAIMRVARLPTQLSLLSPTEPVELPDEFQLILGDWVAYRCFSNDDADGRNDGAADKAEARFHKGLNSIKRDTYRLRTGNTATVRGKRIK